MPADCSYSISSSARASSDAGTVIPSEHANLMVPHDCRRWRDVALDRRHVFRTATLSGLEPEAWLHDVIARFGSHPIKPAPRSAGVELHDAKRRCLSRYSSSG